MGQCRGENKVTGSRCLSSAALAKLLNSEDKCVLKTHGAAGAGGPELKLSRCFGEQGWMAAGATAQELNICVVRAGSLSVPRKVSSRCVFINFPAKHFFSHKKPSFKLEIQSK